MTVDQISCWIVTEGLAGTENQCLGITDSIGLSPEIKRISLRQPWKTLSPPLLKSFSWSFQPTLGPPWPDILISSGRKSIPASLYIKEKSQGRTFTLHIQDPRINPEYFDLVAVPHHDNLRGKNVIVTDGAPNRVTEQTLETGRVNFQDQLSDLPSPRVAVLIGGKSKAYDMTYQDTERLVHNLESLVNQGFGIMITASRRSGEDNIRLLKEKFQNVPNVYLWDGT